MKNKTNHFYGLSGLLVCLLMGLGRALPVAAQVAPGAVESYAGDVLCLPQAFPALPQDCRMSGPAAQLNELAKQGFEFPLSPLPTRLINVELFSTPYRYIDASRKPIPTYGSLADAMSKSSSLRTIIGGMTKYLSYTQRENNDKGIFYRIQTGEWIDGTDFSRVSASVAFRGLQVLNAPRNDFGWAIDETEVRLKPGGEKTGRKIKRFELVTAYAVEKLNDTDWVRIGVNEWVEDRRLARVYTQGKAPEGVSNGRWIEVNLFEQTLSVYDNNRLVFATLISSGSKPFYTRPGLFKIYKKLAVEQMTGTFEADRSDYYYLENVPWTMYFDEARALHGVYWHTLFGYMASHGCVNLTVADARWVFDWAKDGDAVYVWDISGETPTDVKSTGGP